MQKFYDVPMSQDDYDQMQRDAIANRDHADTFENPRVIDGVDANSEYAPNGIEQQQSDELNPDAEY